jgi:hypothetical protein
MAVTEGICESDFATQAEAQARAHAARLRVSGPASSQAGELQAFRPDDGHQAGAGMEGQADQGGRQAEAPPRA